MPTTLIGPPLQPPAPPLSTGVPEQDIKILIDYLNSLVAYFYEQPITVIMP